jgi:hypothetical protein
MSGWALRARLLRQACSRSWRRDWSPEGDLQHIAKRPVPPAVPPPCVLPLMRRFLSALLTVAIVGFGALLLVARRAERRDAAAGAAVRATVQSLAGVQVRHADGTAASIVPSGGGVVALVLSTCPHCHLMLQEFAAAPNPTYTHLSIVSVDGAVPGQRMLDSLHLATHVTDLGAAKDSVLKGLGVTGVPTFFKVDATGKVLGTLVGEVEPAALAPWIAAAR